MKLVKIQHPFSLPVHIPIGATHHVLLLPPAAPRAPLLLPQIRAPPQVRRLHPRRARGLPQLAAVLVGDAVVAADREVVLVGGRGEAGAGAGRSRVGRARDLVAVGGLGGAQGEVDSGDAFVAGQGVAADSGNICKTNLGQ